MKNQILFAKSYLYDIDHRKTGYLHLISIKSVNKCDYMGLK